MDRTTRRIGDLIEPACALFALVMGALAVTGWLTGQLQLASIAKGLPPAKANADLAFVFLGSALLLRAGSHDGRRAALGTGLAIAAGCIGLATLAEYATGVNLGIDELIVVDHSGVGPDPGRMAALVTVAISLMAGSIVLHGRAGSAGLLRWLLALGAFTAGYISLLGLSFGALQISTVFGFGPEIALPAALSVLALGLAGLACYHMPSPTSILLSSTPGARIARVLVVAGMVGLPAVGWFSRLGEDAGLFTREFGAVVLVATSGILVAIVGLWAGTWADRFQQAEKLTLEQATKMEGRYRGLLEAAPDAMVVVNGAGEIVLLNLQAEKQFGYNRDELVGQPVTNIIPEGFAERLIADDLRSAAAALAQQIGTGIELVARRKDATEFPIEIILSPLESAGGILVTAAIRDISVRNAAEEQLSRTTQLLETTQAVARVGGWELDVVHDTMFWNAETYRIHETSPAEYSPTIATAIGFYAPESIPLITAAMRAATERGMPFDLELELITAAGRRISVRAMSAVTMELGRTVKITGAIQDITELKLLGAQLRQAKRLEAVGQLAGGIAHDFNNILTAIRGYAEFARRDLEEDEGRRDDLDQVISNVDRAAALIRQLLAFSRRQVLQSEVLDPSKVVEGVAPMLDRLLGEHVELATHMAPDLWSIKVDPGQLEQVVVNLAVNAADAMPDGGKLIIELSNVALDEAYAATHANVVPGAYVLLAVSDTGIGMDAETERHVFEPFFTTKEVGKGTGMGLATVYGIVNQSGGSINVYSEPGHGTIFRIYLPRVAEEPTAAVTETLAARPSWSGSETILLAEDAPAVRGFARRTLEAYGYVVLEATGGADALAIAAAYSGPIELLVTDIVMPGLQGHQLAAQLVAARPEVRVLYVSGFTENSVIHHGVPDHGVAFLPKPFSIEGLGEAVRAVLDGRPG
jgi:PAS domain S-box-containing protein